jgi:membrane protease YdiL (CAAX protease family)
MRLPAPLGTRPLLLFLLLTFAITWGGDTLLRLSGAGSGADAWYLLFGAGPSLAGLVTAALVGGRAEVGRLLRRAARWRVAPGWYALVLLAVPLLLLAGSAVAFAVSGEQFRLSVSWWVLPLLLLVVLLGGPLGEELGWRAFALPRLLDRMGWVPASVALGLVWALWHRVPSTWSDIIWDDPLAPDGPGSLLLSAVVPDVALAVVMGWVFVRTGGSALLAGIGLHAAANLALLAPLPPTGPDAVATTWALTWTVAGLLSAMGLGVVLLDRRRETPAEALDPAVASPAGR